MSTVCEWLLIIQGSCVKEVKGPLLIFKCLLNWCHDTPSLHLPTFSNVQRDKIQERRPSEGNLFGGLPNQSKAELAAKTEQLDISHEQVHTESAWAELADLERPSFINLDICHPLLIY